MNFDIVKNKFYNDHRGSFYELPKSNILFKQESISISNKDVVRGLHYQYDKAMGKEITVLNGSILECIVDIRKTSDTFGEYQKFQMVQKDTIYVPAGFAHGFLALEDNTIILYRQTELYNPKGEGSIYPYDKKLNIDWNLGVKDVIMSDRDRKSDTFEDYIKKNILWES